MNSEINADSDSVQNIQLSCVNKETKPVKKPETRLNQITRLSVLNSTKTSTAEKNTELDSVKDSVHKTNNYDSMKTQQKYEENKQHSKTKEMTQLTNTQLRTSMTQTTKLEQKKPEQRLQNADSGDSDEPSQETNSQNQKKLDYTHGTQQDSIKKKTAGLKQGLHDSVTQTRATAGLTRHNDSVKTREFKLRYCKTLNSVTQYKTREVGFAFTKNRENLFLTQQRIKLGGC